MNRIYGLVCPFTEEIRYIGKTNQTLKARLNRHVAECGTPIQSHKLRWLRNCLRAGLRPRMWELEEVPDGTRWQDRERAWIGKAKSLGFDLVNQTPGGEGLDYVDPVRKTEYLATLSAAMSKVRAEKPELTQRMIEGNRKSWAKDRPARIASIKAAWAKPENKVALAEAMAQVRQRPGYAEGRVAIAKRNWETSRDAMLAGFATPECKARQSAAKKATWSTAEGRENMMNRWTPEARAKQAAEILGRRGRIQAAMTPEVRAKQAASLKATWARRKLEQADAR